MARLIYSLLLLSLSAQADNLSFSKAIPVSITKPGVFHHLDASGRKNIVVSNNLVSVVWEDNRSGTPQVYTAFKKPDSTSFTPALQLSQTGTEAYEPTVLTLGNNTFLYAWEQNQTLWITTVHNNQVSKAVVLDKQPSSQVSLAKTTSGKVYAAWIQYQANLSQVVFSEIKFNQYQPQPQAAIIVDHSTKNRQQNYPSLVAVNEQLVLGWEDREHGHTRIYTSYSADRKTFAAKQLLNDFIPPPNPEFGRGTGATRVALASDGNNKVGAVWMDKRDFLGGYDIYAAFSNDGGKHFADDEKAQDMLGENQPQWHPAIAMTVASNDDKGKIIAAWDDPRDDTPDIWYSTRDRQGWSDDEVIAPASGEHAQTSPSIVFDQQNRLHIAWLHQTPQGTTLYYAYQQ